MRQCACGVPGCLVCSTLRRSRRTDAASRPDHAHSALPTPCTLGALLIPCTVCATACATGEDRSCVREERTERIALEASRGVVEADNWASMRLWGLGRRLFRLQQQAHGRRHGHVPSEGRTLSE